ncbi:D-lactate dehydrogenase [Methylobacterium nodulans]|uniref:Quinone-dependent D-lactate dehydrogenase n=1 Tax=Methylobacterium nodulans (strain LMG 21967 / CNCM I-2342 / ORS 2060) TaxID=460265 RepID=B8IIE3_METNO|nr:D-lactate dehydrogenase [Methylobacterium nodulans]ACL58012.1 D-lactate dehydrogenase membrane binding [Methylobacterium nodulans ORS 2060]
MLHSLQSGHPAAGAEPSTAADQASKLPADTGSFLDTLRAIVGRRHVLTHPDQTRRFRTGYRFGGGNVLAVVRPGSLVEQWRVLQACVQAGKIIIMQAANTGLTGGSTPDGDTYDREVVLLNTMRMRTVRLIEGGQQVVCLPGATLDQLEKTLKPLGREPHSVIGSSCIGASVLGGICNNSGGALIQRGPAYTELALFARVDEKGRLELINHLGIQLGESPEDILERLDRWDVNESDIDRSASRWASDRDYADYVRDVDADTPARFNADARRLHEASGCAGKLAVFAVRLDTFPADEQTTVFYIGTNDVDNLTKIRRHILGSFIHLPVAGEYIHRDAFDIAEQYGKDTFLLIRALGTSRLPTFFKLKSSFDALAKRVAFLPADFSDRVLQAVSRWLPSHLPARIRRFRDAYEHHLLLKMSGEGAGEAGQFLRQFFETAEGGFFECTTEEGNKAFLHRFAVAGAAVRYRAVHAREVEDIVALDIALRRNETNWFETLPFNIDEAIIHKIYYGHFFCHVFHQDYVVKRGVDCLELEHKIWRLLDDRKAEYPAEHNVGHIYRAKPQMREFFCNLDPCNVFNPGIGQTSKRRNWECSSVAD